MPFVARNAHGVVVSLHRQPTPETQEFLPDDHPEVQGFLGHTGSSPQRQASFETLDADFVRVLEDLIDVLIARNVIRVTDLPPEAQGKLFSRKRFRDNQARNALTLFDPAALEGVAHPASTSGDAPTTGGLDVIDTGFHDDLGR
ncbi:MULTISPECIES: hypothetical protein [Caldimonas]|uniref:hypothetical protein n=1 Tax=Caldimonas TaxID=196013 RepID=UPI000362BB8A|nr:hypothetical protein [Caldimonas manganoxidans]